jgi:hypothetical protein
MAIRQAIDARISVLPSQGKWIIPSLAAILVLAGAGVKRLETGGFCPEPCLEAAAATLKGTVSEFQSF